MPPKRKSVPAEADDKSRKVKVVKKAEPRLRSDLDFSAKLDSEYKEPIKYDEYMEGGIPSSLLEGLGFTESDAAQESSPADEDDTAGEVDVSAAPEPLSVLSPPVLSSQGLTAAVSSYVVDQINAMAKSGMISGLLPQQIVDLTMASSNKATACLAKKTITPPTPPVRTSRRLSARNSTLAETVTVDSSQAAVAKQCVTTPIVRPAPSKPIIPSFPSAPGIRQIVSSTPPPPKMMPRSARGYSSNPRTITKGNIVYERMPTGEVIASLIKKPVVEGAGRMNQGNVDDSSVRGAQPSFRASQANTLAPVSLEDCPINEYNVGEVLEKSIKATQSMRMLLTSLRDDLRRIGAGSAMVTEEQVRKRQEVADKLTKAYSTYKRSIEDIETPQGMDSARVSAAAAAAAAGVMTHRVEKPESARPVMLIKHGASVGQGAMANEQPKTWRSTKASPAVVRGRLGQDRGEVIELLESDDEDERKRSASQKKWNSDEGVNSKQRPGIQADATGSRLLENVGSGELQQRNKDSSKQKGNFKGEFLEGGKTNVENTERSGSKDCNGHRGVKEEK